MDFWLIWYGLATLVSLPISRFDPVQNIKGFDKLDFVRVVHVTEKRDFRLTKPVVIVKNEITTYWKQLKSTEVAKSIATSVETGGTAPKNTLTWNDNSD